MTKWYQPSHISQETCDRHFNYGYERTCDIANELPDCDESTAELVGILVGANEALAIRWGIEEKEALKRVRQLF